MKRFTKFLKKRKPQKEFVTQESVDNLISYGIHGIREPLHTCVYILDELKKELEKEEDSVRVQFIKKNIKLLDSLINHTNDVTKNFFDMYKMKNTEVYIKMKPVNIIDIVKDVYTSFKIFENENVSYTLNTNDIEKKIINVDENKLRQILNNVFDNAKEATTSGEINIQCYSKDNKFFIEITDTGKGIDEEIDYFNLNENNKFGLHVSKFLAMKMMGDVSLCNRKDNIQGTVFKCWFYSIEYSNEEENENIEEKTEIMDERLFDKKIVYIEDDYINNSISNSMLQKIGFQKENILSFYDGTEYIQYLNENEGFVPDIMVLDIVLVKLHGDDLCRRLREKGYKIPIAAVTGNLLNSNIIDKYKKCGFDEIVNKPFSIEELKFLITNNLKLN